MQKDVIQALIWSDTRRHLGAALFVLASGFFLFLNTLAFNVDDLSIYYSDNITDKLWSTNVHNYRYLTAASIIIFQKFGVDYINIIGLLCLAIPMALLLCVRQLLHILALPTALLVPSAAAILLHGMWADLHQFTMSYGSFALALFFTALSLAAARRAELGLVTYFALALSCALAALLAYQPFLVILPLSAGLLGLRVILLPDDAAETYRDIRLGCILVAVFFTACVLFYIIVLIIGGGVSTGDRSVSMGNIQKNILPYFNTLIDQVFSKTISFGNILPLHERIVYGLILPSAILLLAAASWRASNAVKLILGTTAAMAALLLAPGPFNLYGDVFWPSGRSTSPIAFFHVLGAALIIVFSLQRVKAARHRWSDRVQLAVCIFIGLSVANHLSLLFERVRQSRQDWAVGQSILAEMRKKGTLRDNQPIAVVATWHNAAQLRRVFFMDYGASAFTAPWSRVPMLRLVSGNQFIPATVSENVCQGFQPPFEVRQHDEVLVACME